MVTPRRPITPEIGRIPPSLNTTDQIRTKPITYDSSPMFDFAKGDFAIVGGNISMVHEKVNLEQWVSKTLGTAVSTYLAYNSRVRK